MQIAAVHADLLSSDQLAAWSELQRADPSLDNPFLSVEFAMAVAAVRSDVEVAVLTERGASVGFLPFQRDASNVGRAVGWGVSDLQGIVVDRQVDWEPERLLRDCGLRAWHFDHMVASQEPFRPYHYFVDDAPYMDLSRGYEAYERERRLETSLVSLAARKARKLSREVGPLRFDLHTMDPRAFAALVAWKREQLARRGFHDTLALDWVVELLRRLWATQTHGLEGVLSTLWAADRLIAVHLGIRAGKVLASWIPTFHRGYARYSPGVVMHLALARKAAETGITRIELGRGENQMKACLMSGAIPVAIGSIELRPFHKALWAGYYGSRRILHSSLLRGTLLPFTRRIRNSVRAY